MDNIIILLVALVSSIPDALFETKAKAEKEREAEAEVAALIDCHFDAINVYRCKPVDYSLAVKKEK